MKKLAWYWTRTHNAHENMKSICDSLTIEMTNRIFTNTQQHWFISMKIVHSHNIVRINSIPPISVKIQINGCEELLALQKPVFTFVFIHFLVNPEEMKPMHTHTAQTFQFSSYLFHFDDIKIKTRLFMSSHRMLFGPWSIKFSHESNSKHFSFPQWNFCATKLDAVGALSFVVQIFVWWNEQTQKVEENM